jgi:uncharacterized membrane protein YwzB
MDITILSIIELFLFFVTFPFVFQAFNAFDTSRIFRKGYIWQIQIIYIFSSVIFTYLFIKAIVNLIQISANIFS